MGNAGDDAPHAHKTLVAVQLLFKLPVFLHALGQYALRTVNKHEQQAEKHHGRHEAHDHNDALKGQHLFIVARNILREFQSAHDGSLQPWLQGFAFQGIEHTQNKGALLQRQPEGSLPGGYC